MKRNKGEKMKKYNRSQNKRVIVCFYSFMILFGLGVSGMTLGADSSVKLCASANIGVVSSKSSEEAELVKQGYRETFTSGLDHVKQEREFAEVLRESYREGKFDPKKTHVQHYADQVEGLLKHIEEGIQHIEEDYVTHLRSGLISEKRLNALAEKGEFKWLEEYKSRNKEIQDEIENKREMVSREEVEKILVDFKREARERVKNNQVTYDWWVKFNFRSSHLLSLMGKYREHTWWKSHFSKTSLKTEFEDEYRSSTYLEHIATLVESFPGVYALLTTKDLGIMAFNEVSGESIALIEIPNRRKYVDGPMNFYTPYDFAQHDIGHYYVIDHQMHGDYVDFWKFLTNRKRSLSREEREKVESAYFLERHEPREGSLLDGSAPMEDMYLTRLQKRYDLEGVLPDHVDHKSEKQVKDYLLSSVQSLVRLKHEFDSIKPEPEPEQHVAPKGKNMLIKWFQSLFPGTSKVATP